MGFTCFVCGQHIVGNASSLFHHLRLIHNLISGGLFNKSVTCGQEGCLRTFQHTWSFKRHLNSQHRGLITCTDEDVNFLRNVGLNEVVMDNAMGGDSDEENEEDEEVEQREHNVNVDHFCPEELKQKGMNLVCAMRSSTSVVQNTVNLVANQISDLFEDVIGYLKRKTAHVVSQLGVDEQNELLQNLLEEMTTLSKPFADIETAYKQNKYILQSKFFINPREIPITVGYAPRLNPGSGEVRQHPVQKTFQYVPIKEVLKLVLESPGYMESIQEVPVSNDGLLRYFKDGSLCKNSALLSDASNINILMFIDDVEVTNPLSPKAGSHKLGMIYFAIKSLPAKYLSSLNNCFLLAIYKSCDGKDFGLEEVINCIVTDLKSLQDDGLFIETPVFTGIVRVSLAQVVGDNLGIHGLFGFTESFTANFFCRRCKGHRDVLRKQTVENIADLRNLQNYEDDLAEGNVSTTGIKGTTPLNQLRDFHVTRNYAHDIMHDLFTVFSHIVGQVICNIWVIVNWFLHNST